MRLCNALHILGFSLGVVSLAASGVGSNASEKHKPTGIVIVFGLTCQRGWKLASSVRFGRGLRRTTTDARITRAPTSTLSCTSALAREIGVQRDQGGAGPVVQTCAEQSVGRVDQRRNCWPCVFQGKQFAWVSSPCVTGRAVRAMRERILEDAQARFS